MSCYRRARTGPTYFFTLVSFERRPILCSPPIRNLLRLASQNVRAKRPFDIDAWVLMPDHLHCIWTLPDGDTDYSTRWAQIKRTVSRFCDTDFRAGHPVSASRRKHRDSVIWQRRFYEHQIVDERDFRNHVDMSISIRCGMGMPAARQTGRFRPSIGMCGLGSFRRIGAGQSKPEKCTWSSRESPPKLSRGAKHCNFRYRGRSYRVGTECPPYAARSANHRCTMRPLHNYAYLT